MAGQVLDLNPDIIVGIKNFIRQFFELDYRKRNIQAVMRKLVTNNILLNFLRCAVKPFSKRLTK